MMAWDKHRNWWRDFFHYESEILQVVKSLQDLRRLPYLNRESMRPLFPKVIDRIKDISCIF
jgi:hypothetical protein